MRTRATSTLGTVTPSVPPALALRHVVNVVPDYRQPDSIRLAISPLPTSYVEVWDGFDRLRGLMESGAYREVAPQETRVT